MAKKTAKKSAVQVDLFKEKDYIEYSGSDSLAPGFVGEEKAKTQGWAAKRIAEEGAYIQSNAFADQTRGRFSAFPTIHNTVEDFRRILRESEGPLGCDFEFEWTYKATHIGISTLDEAVCVRSTPELIRELVADLKWKGRPIVGHSVIGAERKVIQVATGELLDLKYFEDSMISHHLTSADLCSAPGKGEDAEEKGSLGFMDLWCMASLHTMLPAWKTCPGKDCAMLVCPIHRKDNYCAVDSYASLAGHYDMMRELEDHGVSHDYYRRKHLLAEIAWKMEEQGIRVDKKYVREFEAASEEKKLGLFPYEMQGKKKKFEFFNPKSPDQVLEYFKRHNIAMETADKSNILRALEKQAAAHGFSDMKDLEAAEELPEVLDNLYKLHLFKEAGKGLKAWFDDRYIDRDGLIHPRFVITGTSTDRWSSSRPNFTNVPVRGDWGKMVKKSVVPREAGLEIADADASQLELRTCLVLAGMDAKDVPPKVFEFIVDNSNGAFDKAAGIMATTPRQVAKSFTHGGNYMESFQLIYPDDLFRTGIKREIEAGARRVYLKSYNGPFDWTFRGKIVTFTGTNIAERIFGDKSYENRRKALEILEDAYMANFPIIRRWQKSVLDQVQEDGYVKSPFSGRFLRLYGHDDEQCKAAIAFLGQGVSAEHMQSIIIRRYLELGEVPLIHVHDSLVIEFPTEWSDKKLYDHYRSMFEATDHIPGFAVPGEIKRGPTYGDLRKIAL